MRAARILEGKWAKGVPENPYDDDIVVVKMPVDFAYKHPGLKAIPHITDPRAQSILAGIKDHGPIYPHRGPSYSDPIEFGQDPRTGKFSISDGHHRVAVAHHLGKRDIAARMFKWTARNLGLL